MSWNQILKVLIQRQLLNQQCNDCFYNNVDFKFLSKLHLLQEHEKQMEELKSDVERLKEEKTIDISKVSHVARFIKVVKHFFLGTCMIPVEVQFTWAMAQ